MSEIPNPTEEVKMPEITMIGIEKIKEYPINAKTHPEKQIKKLEASITEFGFNVPVVIDKFFNIIAGHGRILAARNLKIPKIPCIMAEHLTKEQVRAYRLADNKTAESDWDFELLKVEFEELKHLGADLESTGFDMKEINPLISGGKRGLNEAAEEEFVEVNAYERAKSKTKIQKGDVYLLGDHRIMCGDSTKSEDVGILMQDEIPILMVTDPPYGVNYDPKWRDEADKKGLLGNNYPSRAMGEVPNDDIIDWSAAYKLFKGDICYVWHAGKHTKEVSESLQKSQFEIINQIIWVKPHFILSRDDYHWKHEPCLYCVRKGKKHNWQGDRSQTTVWEIAGMNCFGGSKKKEDEMTGHGTQKPLECMRIPIINNTLEKDLVYDPFGGSGTTLIACEKMDRKCRMMEIDPVYCQVIIDRWEKYTSQKAAKLN